MNLPDLSIKRPVFVSCIFIVIMVIGVMSFRKLAVDMFPDVTIPMILVTTVYPGAGPKEIESLVSQPIEDSFSNLGGVKKIYSINKEAVSTVIVEFNLETDIKYAEQQIRDKLSTLKNKLPTDSKDPILKTINFADQPILILSLSADLPPNELYELADREIRSLIEQVENVGLVNIVGGRKREIQVLLDKRKMKEKGVSATFIAQKISLAGKNVPGGKIEIDELKDADVRTVGEFSSLDDIRNTLINFVGNETPIRLSDVAKVEDYFEDEKNISFINGKRTLTLHIYRRSGANTVAVVDAIKKRVASINNEFKNRYKNFEINVVRDYGHFIRNNVNDVRDAIILGIILTVLVVYFFLGNFRSTFITSIALPDSLLGTFILMAAALFSVNVMTLLAMSLAVGLLVDDAIVVRENIFRHIESGSPPIKASSQGAREVTLAVIATTACIIAVFGPVAFLEGMVGRFFKEFGLTVCFAMAISLFDALTMAPMLSAYFAGNINTIRKNFIAKSFGYVANKFYVMQNKLRDKYGEFLDYVLTHRLIILGSALLIVILSLFAFFKIPKIFMPTHDNGEFMVYIDTPPGTNLETTSKIAQEIDTTLRAHKEVEMVLSNVGGMNNESNEAWFYVKMVPFRKRKIDTAKFKEIVRTDLKRFSDFHPNVQDVGMLGSGGITEQPFNIAIIGNNLDEIQKVSGIILEKLRNDTNLRDPDVNFRRGQPEFRVTINKEKAEILGVSPTNVGMELRTLIEGTVPAVYRENDKEYDIRVRLKKDERNLREHFKEIYVPNMNFRLVKLSDVAKGEEFEGPNTINRLNRARYVKIGASLNPKGEGLGKIMSDIKRFLEGENSILPAHVRYKFIGMAESFIELIKNMTIAAILATIFIYLVLASLYDSFITPLTIMLVLPLAVCGAFYALWITGHCLDIFSMIGCIMLLGLAAKNSILLVDYTKQKLEQGKDLTTAIIEAGKTRFRPIIMTSVALIVGMIPVAIGFTEASRFRAGMGIAVIGGLITSTVLTLVVVPAAFSYMEQLRKASMRVFQRLSTLEKNDSNTT